MPGINDAIEQLRTAESEQAAGGYHVPSAEAVCDHCGDAAAAFVSKHNEPLAGALDLDGYESHAGAGGVYYHTEGD